MFKPGDVVRIKDEACGPDGNSANQRWVREHGYLWIIIEGHANYRNEFFAKSVATGAEFYDTGGRFYWYTTELEKADVQEG